MQVQVVPELLHLQLHKLRPLQQVAVETLTGVTEAGTRLLLGRATATVVLLTVHTNVLRERDRCREDVSTTGSDISWTQSQNSEIQNQPGAHGGGTTSAAAH